MTELEILKEQVKALEKLLELKNQIIVELEKPKPATIVWKENPFEVKRNVSPDYKTFIVDCGQAGCDYPSPWLATVPPHCKRCGKQGPSYTFTCTSGSLTNNG